MSKQLEKCSWLIYKADEPITLVWFLSTCTFPELFFYPIPFEFKSNFFYKGPLLNDTVPVEPFTDVSIYKIEIRYDMVLSNAKISTDFSIFSFRQHLTLWKDCALWFQFRLFSGAQMCFQSCRFHDTKESVISAAVNFPSAVMISLTWIESAWEKLMF